MSHLLHTEIIRRRTWIERWILSQLAKRAAQIRTETAGLKDPDVSIVIRTKNDMEELPALIEDIRAQEYDGEVEIILVDTSSSDGTAEFAASQNIRVITLSQASFTYPKALNLGFDAARHEYVVSLVGHSSLSNTMMLRCLTLWHGLDNFGGLYGLPLPGRNASRSERCASAIWMPRLIRAPIVMRQARPGMLGANASIVSHSAWKKLGGYDERYVGGGEDTALGRSMIEAGMAVVYEPAFSVFHSHGLGPINMFRQLKHWREVAQSRPQPFDAAQILNRRPDLRRKEKI